MHSYNYLNPMSNCPFCPKTLMHSYSYLNPMHVQLSWVKLPRYPTISPGNTNMSLPLVLPTNSNATWPPTLQAQLSSPMAQVLQCATLARANNEVVRIADYLFPTSSILAFCQPPPSVVTTLRFPCNRGQQPPKLPLHIPSLA